MECDVCAGLLVTEAHKLDGRVVVDSTPCDKCLVYPATEDVRTGAREWMGGLPDFPGWRKFVPSRSSPRRDAHYAGVVPLYQQGGKDLAYEVVAARWNIHNFGVRAIFKKALLYSLPGPMASAMGISVDDCRTMIRTISGHASADLREGRALALCLAATEPTPASPAHTPSE